MLQRRRMIILIEYVTVEFKSKVGVCSIKLYTKFTCIYGKDSGEGKTQFLNYLREAIELNSLRITASNGQEVHIVPEGGLEDALKIPNRILILDEATSVHCTFIKLLQNYHGLLICISRNLPLKGDYGLKSIYLLKRTNTWFTLINDNSLRMYDSPCRIDQVITEAGEGHSENELLKLYIPNIMAAGGRDNIPKLIRNIQGNVLVFTDLGNIGRIYHLLKKRCIQYESLYVYNYQAFEELLYKSKLVNGTDSLYNISSLYFISLERYFEKALEDTTKGTPLEYHHGKYLSAAYLDIRNCQKIFDTTIGKPLWELINTIKLGEDLC